MWTQGLAPPQRDVRDDDSRGASSQDRATLGEALAALLAAHRTQVGASDSLCLARATEFSGLLDSLYFSLMGQPLLGNFSPEEMIWPEGLEASRYGLGVFSPQASPSLNLRALSLSNPPLQAPVVVVTRIDQAAEEALSRHGLPRGQALQVVGTYRDGDGEPHVLLGRGDPLNALERHLSIPAALLSEILSHIIIGDARIEQALRDSETAHAKVPVDRACCRHVTASAGLSETPRVAHSALQRGGDNCWVCPYAHDLCQPGGAP